MAIKKKNMYEELPPLPPRPLTFPRIPLIGPEAPGIIP